MTKTITQTALGMLAALLGFVAAVAWAQDGRNELEIARAVICACVGTGNVA